MRFVDTHVHLEEVEGELDDVLAEARAAEDVIAPPGGGRRPSRGAGQRVRRDAALGAQPDPARTAAARPGADRASVMVGQEPPGETR